jgi:hypothetical protein
VLSSRELVQVLEVPPPESSRQLAVAWQRHWNRLGEAQVSAATILDSVDNVREDTLNLLAKLD